MIISASRRTDIPAFYGDWFMNRLRSGYCLVSNPWNPRQVRRVSLAPDEVDAVVFWTKNPAPLMCHLAEMDRMGFMYCFLFTLNSYPADIESNIPHLNDRIGTFLKLSSIIGPERVVWRYDPIIMSKRFNSSYHMRAFEEIAGRLSGSTGRSIISIADFYAKTERRLAQIEVADDDKFVRDPFLLPEFGDMIRSIVAAAAANGMSIQSCSEDERLTSLGVDPGKCIDDQLLANAFDIRVTGRRDRGQRSKCLCVQSQDIGANNSCPHGCAYCYATTSQARAELRYGSHDPKAERL